MRTQAQPQAQPIATIAALKTMRPAIKKSALGAALLLTGLLPAQAQTCESGVCSLSSAPQATEKSDDLHNINTFQMKGYVDSGKAIILDARSGKYDDGYRIPGAQSLNSQSSAEEIAKVIPNKDTLVVTYCSNLQCPAGKALAVHLKKLGYTNVLEYPEGIAGWRAGGGDVHKMK